MNKHYCAINNWLIDVPSGSILHLVTGERKRLGAYQLKLLDVLQQNAGKILTREELTTLVWERRVIGNNSLPNAIHALRAALEDDGKQQRIIRTIPKHGYVLEAEYCRMVEKDEEEINLTNVLPAQDDEEVLFDEALDTIEHEPVDTYSLLPDALSPAVRREAQMLPSRAQRWKVVLVFLVIALGSAALGYSFIPRSEAPEVREIAKNIYSNIRIFTVPGHENDQPLQQTTFLRLRDTYYTINQQLKSKSIHMSVYYNDENQTLNYTLRLYNICQQKVLAMQIYHSRSNATLLNNLILSETRRKLNEMVPCKTP
ncbi:winged helix-turn-helix domain-containing protein [Enterobacter sp. AG5470]|uniref:transcriptional regulator n=1 Tax=Kosakonia sp. WA-90 TaxID=3153576 RepID=UPI001068C5A1|nr:DNA-binding winged helix-turn-helix (wHTH) protein [Enterobacter sp. AG5470]